MQLQGQPGNRARTRRTEEHSLPKGQTPRLEGSALTLTLDDKQIDMVMEKLVGPPVRRTAEAAASEHSMNNIRNIVLACAAYTRTHEGEWPDNLHVLLDPKLLSTDRFFRNPRRPELAVGYVLVKPSKKAVEAGANETVVIYEAYDAWPQGGINVGFADGHVQLMTDEAAFKKRLGESIDGPARP